MLDGILYWITGLSGAGKTTIGNRLYYEIKKIKSNVILLDGDILKNIVCETVDYSEAARRKRAMKYAALCKVLTDQGQIVICCTIAMYDEVREWNRMQNKGYVEVFLNVPMNVLRERDQKGLYSKFKGGMGKNVSGEDLVVEYPKHPDIEIVNDGSITIAECVRKIMEYKVKISSDYDRDTEYWNHYYKTKKAPEEASLFAQWIIEDYLSKGKNLLELGCGNGRDSLFFMKNGLNVTAIDASHDVIQSLNERYAHEGNICFICDDFVCCSAVFSGQYDYVYSRFSLHAINKEQEEEVIKNVYKVLKEDGKFFVEVRSVNDELYGKGNMIEEDAYIYDGHYRRFVRINNLVNSLKKIGFHVIYAKEDIDFAPYEGANPPIIRIVVAKKKDCNYDLVS